METLGTSYPHQGGEPQPGTSGGGCSRSDRPAPVVVLRWSGPDGWRVQAPALTARSGAARTLSDGGFSLIELMIALVVLAVLLAIAVPTFLGSTGTADNRSAQSNLGTALTDAKAQFQNGGQTYFVNGTQDSTAFAGLLTAAQLSLTFHAGSLGTATTQGSSGSLSTLSVAVSADGNGVVMAAFSIPGNCYYVVDNTMALSTAAKAATPFVGTTAVTSTAVAAPAGSIGLPSAAGTNYVQVKGDSTMSDCNAYTPKTSGSPVTVQYLTSGFPF